MVHVKISGLTAATQAACCVELGATAIGVIFCANDPRQVTVGSALEIARAARAIAREKQVHVDIVGIVANMPLDAMRALAKDAELDCLELAGDESPDMVSALLPRAYKAVYVASNADLLSGEAFPGDYLLVDVGAYRHTPLQPRIFVGAQHAAPLPAPQPPTMKSRPIESGLDWMLLRALSQGRKLTLAGGLHPGNVRDAVSAVRPFCVDVTSGVERSPGDIDFRKVKRFILAAKSAYAAI
ncbi:MAG: phosphoribosylanthranilate isomerase [Polyangiaceae bacterium]|nr:phosphoribosylanthranilate isomerase [Polyangiaceae bacterium]